MYENMMYQNCFNGVRSIFFYLISYIRSCGVLNEAYNGKQLTECVFAGILRSRGRYFRCDATVRFSQRISLCVNSWILGIVILKKKLLNISTTQKWSD